MNSIPKRCPACNDQRQRRPTITRNVTCLREWEALQITSLPPGQWEFRQHQEVGEYVLDFSGKQFGHATWQGRIVLRAPASVWDRPPAVGDIISLREMRSDVEAAVDRRGDRVLVPAARDEAGDVLGWAHSHSKTTLKGLGRQYAERIENLGLAQATWRVSCACRTGRIQDDGVLFVAANDVAALIRVVHEEDGHEETVVSSVIEPPIEDAWFAA